MTRQSDLGLSLLGVTVFIVAMVASVMMFPPQVMLYDYTTSVQDAQSAGDESEIVAYENLTDDEQELIREAINAPDEREIVRHVRESMDVDAGLMAVQIDGAVVLVDITVDSGRYVVDYAALLASILTGSAGLVGFVMTIRVVITDLRKYR